MTGNWILCTILLCFILLSGCTRHELCAIHGQSSVLSSDWKSKVHVGQTTEMELLALLGKPTRYYHQTPNTGEKYLFYSSIATVRTINHYPFFPEAQYFAKKTSHKAREWFFISKGKLSQHISCDSPADDPDLKDYIGTSGPEYPYCEQN